MNISTLPPSRWKDYRDLRLEALKTEPQAFGSSYQEYRGKPPGIWKDRLKSTNGRLLFALTDGQPVGMIGIHFETQIKVRHLAHVISFFVRSGYRGQGIAKLLLQEALQHLTKRRGIKKVKLTVNPKQAPAIHLYERHGFRRVGILKRELKIGARFHDELVMEKLL